MPVTDKDKIWLGPRGFGTISASTSKPSKQPRSNFDVAKMDLYDAKTFFN